MSASSVTVRPAQAADSRPLADLARRTFREAFSHTVSPESMTAYLAASFAPEQVSAEIADAHSLFLLAEHDRSLVGYAKLHFGDPLPGVIGAAPVKLWRLYTLAARQSQGVGAALLDAAVSFARARGGKTLWLTVNKGNSRAIAFYERQGFVITGETLFNLGGETHYDWLMEKPL